MTRCAEVIRNKHTDYRAAYVCPMRLTLCLKPSTLISLPYHVLQPLRRCSISWTLVR